MADNRNQANPDPLIRQQIKLASLTALLAFLGGVGGSYVGSYFEIGRWRLESKYAAHQELVRKRIELVERTVRLTAQIGNAALMKALAAHGTQEAARLQRSGDPTYSTLEAAAGEALKLNELQADVGATLTLDGVYFGRETREAVGQMQRALETAKPWWEVNPKLFRTLLGAMEKELLPDLDPPSNGTVEK